MRIRHFGFLSNRCRTQRIEEIRAAIGLGQREPEPTADAERPVPFDGYPYPLCRKGRLRITAHLAPKRDKGG